MIPNRGARVSLFRPDSTVPISPLTRVNGAQFLFSLEKNSLVTYLKLSSFVYSLTNITSLALPYILKDTLLLSPAQVGLFSALCSAPSFLKPVVTLVLPPSQRPATLSVCALTQTFAYLGIGLAVTKGAASAPLVCGLMFAHSVASSVGMVLRDTFTVEYASNLHSETDSRYFFADLSMIQRIGFLPVSYLSGFLLTHLSPGRVILSAAVFPAVMAVAATALSPEVSTMKGTDPKTQFISAVEVIADKKNGLMSTVSGRSLLTCIVPSLSDAMFFFYTQDLGLTPEFLGRFQLLGAVGGIFGNFINRYCLNAVNPRTVANLATVLQVPLYFSTVLLTSHIHVGISVNSFILTRHFFIDFLLSLTSLPASVQLMQTAPKNAEGTYLALVGTLGDIGGFANSIISSATMTAYGIDRTHFSSLTDMVIVCNSFYAGLTPALFYYDEAPSPSSKKQKGTPIKTSKVEEVFDDDSAALRDA